MTEKFKKLSPRKLCVKLSCMGLILFTLLFLTSLTSALEFDNKLTYLEDDLKIELTNWFGLGTDYGTAKLMSHKTVNEIIPVGLGKQVTMYYDFEFNELYENGLGDVKFINMENGQPVDKEYKFVYWVNETKTRDVYENVCSIALKGENATCEQVFVGKEDYVIGSWQDYNVKTIPKGNIRIGIEVDNKEGDYIDGIWTIGGKEVSLHASWTASLNTNLVSYYKLDETSGTVIDSVGNNNGTNNGATPNVVGQINTAYHFDNASSEYIDLGDFDFTDAITIATWIYYGGDSNWIVAKDDETDGRSFAFGLTDTNKINVQINGTASSAPSSTTMNANSWYFIAFSFDGTNIKYYLNGSADGTATNAGDMANVNAHVNIGRRSYAGAEGYFNGTIDEVALWDRVLTDEEITYLFNSGDGMSYESGSILIEDLSPANETASTNSNINFSVNVTNNGATLSNVTLAITGDDTYNTTNTSGNQGVYTFEETAFADGNYNWQILVYDTDGVQYSSDLRIFSVDTVYPTITVASPSVLEDYGKIGSNQTLNVTFTDSNLDSCWYNYNGTNVTIAGCVSGVRNDTNIILEDNNLNITLYVNDTAGNLNTTIYSWVYKLLQTGEYYNPTTTSGASNIFNITFDSDSQITIAYLNYNNTAYLASITSSGTEYTILKTQIAPAVTDTENISFFWNITRADAFNYITATQNQSVSQITINETCTGMYTIYNFTTVGEKTKTKIDGTTGNTLAKVDLNLYTSSRSDLLTTFYKEFNQTNPVAICMDNNLSGGESFSLDLQIQYSAENYSSEFYNIENYTLNSGSLNQNVTLYDLPTANTQKFRLLARDTSYLPIEGALIQIERKYIENGTFYITEIPKTDDKGITSASLELDDVIYNFYIYEDGELVSSFTNVIAICQTPLVSQCEIDFNAFSTGITIDDFETYDDFNFTIGYNETSRVINSVFDIPSEEPSTVLLVVTSQDTLGTSVCTDTLTSASGTLSCTIPSSFGNSTVIAKLYKDSVEYGKGTIKLDQKSSDIFGSILVILSIMVLMTLVGIGISDNPIITAVFLFVGVILMFAMNLIQNTGFYGASATILFLGIAILIVIIKAARRT